MPRRPVEQSGLARALEILLPRTGCLPADGHRPDLTYRIRIEGWIPPTLNQLTRGKLRDRIRLGKDSRWRIVRACEDALVPAAAGRRRVALTVLFPPGKRSPDVDAFQKAVLDGLVKARALVDDHYLHCEIAPVVYRRGAVAAETIIDLNDLEPVRA